MSERPPESKTERVARLMEAVEKYKNSVEFLPLLGGKIIIPDDIKFLIDEIARLEKINEQLVQNYQEAVQDAENVKADFGGDQR